MAAAAASATLRCLYLRLITHSRGWQLAEAASGHVQDYADFLTSRPDSSGPVQEAHLAQTASGK